MTHPTTSPANEPDALSKALMKSRPELTGRVHYVNGRPWCDGVNHTTMCQPEFEDGSTFEFSGASGAGLPPDAIYGPAPAIPDDAVTVTPEW